MTREEYIALVGQGKSAFWNNTLIRKLEDIPEQEEFDLINQAAKSGGNGLTSYSPVETTFNPAMLFTNLFTEVATHIVSDNITFTVNNTNAIAGACTVVRLVADGTSTVTFSGIKEVTSSSGYDNRNGILNTLIFFYDGFQYYVNIFQEKNATAIDLAIPTLQTAIIADAYRNKIVLTYNESLSTGSIPSTSNFTVSGGKSVTLVEISGSTVTLTVNSTYSYGNVVTVSYTKGTNPIKDANNNEAANLVNQAVTNNIAAPDITAPVLQTAVVSNSVKNRIVLTYNETIDPASVPSTGSFSVSGGKSVSSVSISGSTVNVNTNSDYAYGDVITVSYTGGANKIQDMSGNIASNLSSQAVTNNVASNFTTFQWGSLIAATHSAPNIVNTGQTTPSGGTATVMVDLTQPFDIRTTVPNPITESNGNVVYLDAVQSDTYGWADGKTFIAGFYQFSGTIYAANDGYSANNTGVTASAGDVLRLTNSGSDILLQRSTNGGTDFTTIYTYTGDLSGETGAYVKVLFAAPDNPSRMSVTGNFTVYTPAEIPLTFGNFTGSMSQVSTTLTTTTGSYADNLARATVRLVGDGYIQADWNDSNDTDHVLGFNTVDANANYTDMEYFIWAAGGTQYYIGHGGGNLSPSGVTPQAGDKFRIRRSGSTLIAEYKRGGNWSTLSWASTPATTSADLYITVAGNSPSKLSNPVGFGVV